MMYAHDTKKYPKAYSADPLLVTSCPGMTLLMRGKEKDVYDLGDMLLMISTDRLSAAGKNLGQGIQGKGKIVNQLSAYWFRKLGKVFPNHLVSADSKCFPEPIKTNVEVFDGCSMLVWKTKPLPIRCVVRGYLAGDGWREYQETGEICGTKLPAGLVESQRLPSPIFSPTVKGLPGRVNEKISLNSLQQQLGKPLADLLYETSIRLYYIAWKSARERGVLIADTKFEFGLHDGKLMLIDECLTPDTSRFWVLDHYRCGEPMPSMDKQLLSDYMESLDNNDYVPHLPDEMLCIIGQKYNEAYDRIVGKQQQDQSLKKEKL